jgi:hypothetical protein
LEEPKNYCKGFQFKVFNIHIDYFRSIVANNLADNFNTAVASSLEE